MNRILIKLCLTFAAAMGIFPLAAQTDFRPLAFDEAVAAAKAEGKLVFIDFYTDWCGPCKWMAREVFPQKALGDYMNPRFVCIKLNAEKEGKELASVYKVRAYPTFVVTDVDKKVVMTKIGGAQVENFINELEMGINPEKSPERMQARYDGGERTPDLISAYAAYKMSQSGSGHGVSAKEARRIVKDYFDGLTDEARLAHENVFIYTNYVQSVYDGGVGEFMLTHRDGFASEDKEKINVLIGKLFKEQVYRYIMTGTPYEEETFRKLKQDIRDLKLNKDGWYDGLFRLIECHATGNLSAFIDRCEKEYDALDEEQRSYLISSLGDLVKTDDKALKQRAAQFIRNRLAGMTINQLAGVTYPLGLLEQ